MKLPKNIIIMKVGPHSNMSLDDIVQSKKEEELIHGVHYWGYSGVFCQPKPTKAFCEYSISNYNLPPSLVLVETKSKYDSGIGFIKKYSKNGSEFLAFDKPVQLQGAEFTFVAKNLRYFENFPLHNYKVVGGKNDKKPLLEHLRFRINKSFATLDKENNHLVEKEVYANVLIADLVSPFALWLKD